MKDITNSEIFISYLQVAVSPSGLQQPFNEWTDQHVKQGFSHGRGCVSFKALSDGNSHLNVMYSDQDLVRSNAVRAIRVPYIVDGNGHYEVLTITQAIHIDLEPGQYSLLFQTGTLDDGTMWCALTFRGVISPVLPEILRADLELIAPDHYLMEAKPA